MPSPIFIVLATPTDSATFFTDIDAARADAKAKASAAGVGQEFLVFESRYAEIIPPQEVQETDIGPQV